MFAAIAAFAFWKSALGIVPFTVGAGAGVLAGFLYTRYHDKRKMRKNPSRRFFLKK